MLISLTTKYATHLGFILFLIKYISNIHLVRLETPSTINVYKCLFTKTNVQYVAFIV